MSFRDCLNSAVTQGAISRDEADALAARFDDDMSQLRLSLGDDAAAGAAKAKLEAELRAEGFEAQRRVMLADAARQRISTYLTGGSTAGGGGGRGGGGAGQPGPAGGGYRNANGRPDIFEAALNLLEHHGYAGTSSVVGRTKAIVGFAHAELTDVLSTFRRSRLTGGRFNRPLLNDVVREVLGQDTGKPEAKAMAGAISGVFEDLRLRFNAAGGAIGKISGGYMPQEHNATALLRAGRTAWLDFIRPRLDLQRMVDPLTGGQITPARLDAMLNYSFDAITTGGWAHHTPTTQTAGRGALASQRAEHRFLHFKSPDDWLVYNQTFGSGDPFRALSQHIRGMASDIAAMEVLGPNPNATLNWITQLVQTEAGKAVAGKPSLYDTRGKTALTVADKLNYIPWRIESVWQSIRGPARASGRWATGFANIRNVITSAVLGSASVTAATTDPVLDTAARQLAGIPAAKALVGVAHAFTGASKYDVVRTGIVLDDALHVIGEEARYAGTLGGSEWSKWLADRTVTWSGLEPITQARKHVFARDFEAALADNAKVTWANLNPYLRRSMEGFGIDQAGWDLIRATPAHTPAPNSSGFLRPVDIAAHGGREVGERVAEMIMALTERAVPSGTHRSRAFVTGAAPAGTVLGEIAASGLMFKSFALSFTTLQLQALAHEGGMRSARGAAYAGSLGLALTIGGGLALQLKQIANGKDPHRVDDWRFWFQALQTGGGMGLLGDFLFSDQTRFGHSLAETIGGPVVGLGSDVANLTIANAQQALQGKKTNIGREAVDKLGRYTPIVGSHWALRAAYRRVFLDQLSYAGDPAAHRKWREAEIKLRRETGQEFFWRPGAMAPDRAPDPAGMLPR